MKFNRNKPTYAIWSLFPAVTLLAVNAVAQQQPPQPAKVEKIEVTGTNIKRVDTETAAPVLIITRDEIERSGATTVTEVLRNLSANNVGSFDESGSSGSFAPGAAAISLRGLGVQSTLVLLNGRRIANYGFAVGASSTFVDINSLPLSVVERIEVLKDGASAIYGSEAVAGVVNVILRKDFRGIEANASYGISSERDGDRRRVSLIGGFGDLGRDRYNVFASFEHFGRDAIFATDREISKDIDRTRFGGVRNFFTDGYPGTLEIPSPIPGAPGRVEVRALPGCAPENLLTFNTNVRVGTYCTINANAFQSDIQQEATRNSFYSRLTYDFSSTLSGFAELGFIRNETVAPTSPATPGSWFRVQDRTVQTLLIRLPVGHPQNPFSQIATLRYAFGDVGGRVRETTSDSLRVLAGLSGNTWNWDWQSAVGYLTVEIDDTRTGFIRDSVFREVFANRSYFFGDRSRNPDSLYERLSPKLKQTGENNTRFIDFKASRDLWRLPAGAMAIATGIEYRKEEMTVTPDELVRNGDIVGLGSTRTDGSRNVTSAFAELAIPILKTVEAQLALRTDKFSDYGRSTTPKVGIKWSPSRAFLLRGTYSEGFRAPSLPEIQDSLTSAFTTITSDPTRCLAGIMADCAFPARSLGILFGGNRDLKPEESKSYTLGLVFEPVNNFNVLVDYYSIKRTNQVATISLTFLLNNESQFPGRVLRGPNLATDPPGAPGPLQAAILQFVNQDKVETKGLDLEARLRLSLGEWGRLTFRTEGNYVFSYKAALGPNSPLLEFNSTRNQPRFRINGSVTWTLPSWDVTLSANHVDAFDFRGNPTAACAVLATLPTNCRIKAWTTMNLNIGYTGFKNWRFYANVNNLMDKDPPLDINSTLNHGTTFHNAIGRYYTIGARYSYR